MSSNKQKKDVSTHNRDRPNNEPNHCWQLKAAIYIQES